MDSLRLSSSFSGATVLRYQHFSRSTQRVALCRAQAKFDPSTVDATKVQPQGDRLLVKLEEVAKTTAGGLMLPSSAVKYESQLIGEVISVGPEAKSVTPGQKVMFSDLNGYPAPFGEKDEKLCFVRDSDLMAVVE